MAGFAEGLKSLLSLTKNMDKTVKVRGVSATLSLATCAPAPCCKRTFRSVNEAHGLVCESLTRRVKK